MLYQGERRAFNLMLGGDVMPGRRMTQYTEPGYLGLVELLRGGDLTVVNLETTVRLPHEGTPTISPGTYTTMPPALLEDMKWLGIGMVTCANNHAFDFGEGGLLATLRHLDAAGIPHAGAGANLTHARRPAYADTPAGRVGMVAVTATFPAWSRAGEERADVPGRPGINPLRANLTYRAPQAELAAMRRLADGLGLLKENKRNRQHFFSDKEAPADDGEELHFLGQRFVAGDKPGMESRCEPSDLADNLRWIREARRQCDILVVAVHSHEYGFASLASAEKRSDMTEPADFVVEFARAAIDAGADVVAGHGSHTPLGVEIYKDKPIFYSLGNLVFHNDTVELLPAEAYERFDLPPSATPADFQDTRTAGDTKGHPGDRAFWENVVAECVFENGGLARIVLHPVDQGFGKARTQRGRPLQAGSEVAQRVVERVIRLSAARGTTFVAEGQRAVFMPQANPAAAPAKSRKGG